MKKALPLCLLFLLALAARAVGQEDLGTAFRGLRLDMKRSEIEALKWGSMTVRPSESTPRRLVIKNKNDDFCATVSFDDNGKAKELDLQRCYFDAEDLDVDQFAQAIVNSYHIKSLSCSLVSLNPLWRPKGGPYHFKRCVGPTDKSEWVTVDDAAGIIPMSVKISRRERKPTFD